MTIKHLGGIFGRNPTFNDVTIDGGIYIGGNTSSNLLDDYEEGIHISGITCGTSGTVNLQSNYRLSYTKVGDMVHVQGYLYVGSVSSPVGNFQISLPFTAANLADQSGASAVALYLTNVTAANVGDFVGKIDEGNAYATVFLGDSNAAQADSANELKSGSQIYISATYKAA